MLPKSSLVFAFLVASATLLQAQTASRVIPAGFGYDKVMGNHPISSPFSRTYARNQEVFSASALGFSTAVIHRVEFRRDGFSTGSYPAVTKDILVRVGYTSFTPDNMPACFSLVPSSPLTTVFKGKLNLPVANPPGGLAPWSVTVQLPRPFVFIGAKGNLVLDLEASSLENREWNRDARLVSGTGAPGSYKSLGPGCKGTNGLFPICSATPTAQAVPGRHMRIYLYNAPHKKSPLPLEKVAFSFMSASSSSWGSIPLPFDLAAFGAPGCKLYTGIDAVTSVPLEKTGFNYSRAYAYWLVPNRPSLVGARIYTQWLMMDTGANSMNLIFSNGLEVTLGTPNQRKYVVQSNYTYTPGQDHASQSAYEFAAIVRLVGTFM